MKILVIATQLSQEFAGILLSEHNRHQITVVTPYKETLSTLSDLGITGYLIKQRNMDISVKDRMFAETMLPGKMDAYGNVGEYDLPFWKVISLDRLKFWFDHTAELNSSFIQDFDADKIYVSLDVTSPYPWIMHDYDIPVTAVQIGPIRTVDFYLTSALMEFDEYIVMSDEDNNFLEKLHPKAIIKNLGLPARISIKNTSNDDRKALKEQMGLSGKVIGMIFDKRDEWQARKFLSGLTEMHFPLIFPADPRSKELINSVLYKYKFLVQGSTYAMLACDRVVSFRWDETYFNEFIPETYEIMDYSGMNFAKKIAPEWIKVTE